MQEKKIEIIRIGECKQCGFCCSSSCPHFINEVGLCAIHDHKGDFCNICNETHQVCLDAPPFPMRKGNPDCGYRFYVQGTDLEAIEILCSKKQE